MNKPTVYTQTIRMADGREIVIETGKLAKLANGCVTVRLGETILLATVVANREPREGTDFLPLTVDYQEKYASTGRFPGGFLKRESRLSDSEILVSRLIDRALRPLFPDHFHNEVQVAVSLLSSDKSDMPDALAGLAASAALTISDIPFQGPISEVRVAKINGEYVVNPSFEQVLEATIDIIVSGNIQDINMVEGAMKEVSEAEMLEAIQVAHEAIKLQCAAQLELQEKCGKPKFEFIPPADDDNLKQDIKDKLEAAVYEISKNASSKQGRSDAYKAIYDEYVASQPEDVVFNKDLAKKYYSSLKKETVRRMVVKDKIRLDGRQLDQIRPIWCEVDVLPKVHGSSIFQRGETQALASVTLGTKLDEQMIDGAVIQGHNKFLLHYNFPGFSTGEVKPNRGPARREIGHGNLALRALKAVLPTTDINPYTVRITSDVLESNGSSSMATVCAGTLAMLDAGVRLTKSVSGIAMGLIRLEDGDYAVLSDILGDEDHLGDMDFKVTGTTEGITACQMDLKVDGLSYIVLEQALDQAKRGRLHILEQMDMVQPAARVDYKIFVPRIIKFEIDKEFIGAVIGTGGKVIQGIQKETNTVISIEEVGKFGVIEIASPDKESLDKAYEWIQGIIAVPEAGTVYDGVVKTIQAFGAFVEFLPGKEGLLHISEISYERINEMDGVLNEGDKVQVKLLEVDQKTGKFRLSMKALLPKPEGYVERPPRDDRGPRRDDRGPRRDFNDRGPRRDDDRGPRRDFNDRGPRRDDRNDNRDDRAPRRDDMNDNRDDRAPRRDDRNDNRDDRAPRRDDRNDNRDDRAPRRDDMNDNRDDRAPRRDFGNERPPMDNEEKRAPRRDTPNEGGNNDNENFNDSNS